MSNKLSVRECKELVEQAGDLAVGQQTHIHHCKQGKGNDKLYIKRLNHGSVLFCHHCGKSGFVFGDGVPAKFLQKEASVYTNNGNVSSSERSVASVSNGEEDSSRNRAGGSGGTDERIQFSLPRDASRSIRGWSSPHPKLWLTGNGIKVDSLKDFEIYWSETMGALIFPQRHQGELVGYQYRYFPPKPDCPKYVTSTKPGFIRKNNYLDVVINSSIPTRTGLIVIVEDYISAIRVADLGYEVSPLWGSALYDGQLQYLLQNYNKFVIMLDNDNNQVKIKQRRIAERIKAHGKSCVVIYLDKDPKAHSDEELNSILLGI